MYCASASTIHKSVEISEVAGEVLQHLALRVYTTRIIDVLSHFLHHVAPLDQNLLGYGVVWLVR